MARITYEDPIKVFRYRVLVPGWDQGAGFSECLGLNVENDVVEYREGGMLDTPQKSPGLQKFGDITLRRGQFFSGKSRDSEFIIWCQSVNRVTLGLGGTDLVLRKELVIRQYNNRNEAVVDWYIKEAWPRTYKPMSDMNGNSSENSIEELVLTHEGFTQTRFM